MVSSRFVPWYNRPARPFPANVWLEARYFFRLPPLGISQRPRPGQRRRFPAQVWAEQQVGR